ncbi:MAG: UDP-2,3-diacylglucosamine diphosphatase LpxI [Leptospiraceae bacterium]|nr:UDP-2,3-diacylglucosamine diphosphatase LpxI [Leptospiraceae bacterium]
MGRLAILAGGGELPHIAMKEALLQGEDPIFLGILESEFEAGEYKDRVLPVYISKIGDVLKKCKKNNVSKLLLLGKVKKDMILRGYKFDLKALLARMVNRNDTSFFHTAAGEFIKLNIEIISQKTYLSSLLLGEGRYTKKKLPHHKLEDIDYGMNMASKMAELDIGQTVVVTKKMILAIEAIEGTDETIRRGGELSRKKGAIVCKSSRVGQDERFDLPTVGTQTLDSMHTSGCDTLVIRSGETLVVSPKSFIEYAEKLKISVISMKNSPAKSINKNYIKLS